jgi:hypothetical protein
MKNRKLRIAFSAVCGILCLLTTVLWVRSRVTGDALMIRIDSARGLGIVSIHGRLMLSAFDYSALYVDVPSGLIHYPASSSQPLGASWQAARQITPYPAYYLVVPHAAVVIAGEGKGDILLSFLNK